MCACSGVCIDIGTNLPSNDRITLYNYSAEAAVTTVLFQLLRFHAANLFYCTRVTVKVYAEWRILRCYAQLLIWMRL